MTQPRCSTAAESWSDREAVAPRADFHDHVLAALAGGANSLACVEGHTPFSHLVETGVPQGDFRGRVRRNGDVELESLLIEPPRGRQRPVNRFQRRWRALPTGCGSLPDSGPAV